MLSPLLRNGPFASSFDLGRVVYSQTLGTLLLLAKQLKYMSIEGTSRKTSNQFADYFVSECKREYEKVVATFKKIAADRNDEK